MSVVGCFNETCTVHWEITEETGARTYEATVPLDGDGGLICDDAQGVGIKLDPASPNYLAVTAAGARVQLPEALAVSFGDSFPSDRIPVNADANLVTPSTWAYTATHTWTNTLGVDVVVLLRGQYFLHYAVLGEDSNFSNADVVRAGGVTTAVTGNTPAVVPPLIPFNAQWDVRLRIYVGGAPTTVNDSTLGAISASVQKFSTSGLTQTLGGTGDEFQAKDERREFTHPIVVPAGQVISVASAWSHAGKDQTVNVIAQGTGQYVEMGAYLTDANFVIYPFPA